MFQNFCRKLQSKTREGMSGLVVTVALILLTMILIFVFRNTIVTQINESIEGVAKEIDEISDWDTAIK